MSGNTDICTECRTVEEIPMQSDISLSLLHFSIISWLKSMTKATLIRFFKQHIGVNSNRTIKVLVRVLSYQSMYTRCQQFG